MQQSNQKITEQRLQEFEKSIGANLPADYRAFLLEYNGGVPDKLEFKAKKYGGSVLDCLYGIDVSNVHNNIEQELDLLSTRIPTSFLPIGSDQLGNRILLGIKDKYLGKVYFWWHEDESDKKPWLKNIYSISKSFTGFLNSLFTVEESWGKLQDLFDGNDYAKQLELINSGWDVNTPLESFGTAIERVVMRGSLEVVKALIAKGANFGNAFDKITTFNNVEAAKLLLDSGYDPNSVIEEGDYNVLMISLMTAKGRPQIAKLLIEYGADVTTEINGDTVLSIAEYKVLQKYEGMQEIVDLIKSKM